MTNNDIVVAASEVECCGCSSKFYVYFKEAMLAKGVVACWVTCPEYKGKFVLSYEHDMNKITKVEPLTVSFQRVDDE
jgi:hypothetical protein